MHEGTIVEILRQQTPYLISYFILFYFLCRYRFLKTFEMSQMKDKPYHCGTFQWQSDKKIISNAHVFCSYML